VPQLTRLQHEMYYVDIPPKHQYPRTGLYTVGPEDYSLIYFVKNCNKHFCYKNPDLERVLTSHMIK
jgi:hypothetical protein